MQKISTRLSSIKEEIKQEGPMLESLFEAHQLELQRKKLLQSEDTFLAQSANLKLEKGQLDEDTWREEIYQWLQTLKKLFLPELREWCSKVEARLQQIASAPQPQMGADVQKQHEMLHSVKQLIVLLEMDKHKIEPKYKRHIAKLENDVIHFFRRKEKTSPEKTATLAGVRPAEATSLKISSPQESSVIEQPIQRLLRVVNSMSSATLCASVEALESAVGINERIDASVPEKASKPVVGLTSDSRISKMESVTTFPQRTMIKEKDLLMEEVRAINRRLMSTVVEICDNSTTAAKDGQAKIVKCSFINLATIHDSVLGNVSENLWPIQPLKLLIPGTYPRDSPLVLDKSSVLARDGDGVSSMKNEEDLTEKAISKLKLYLRKFEQPLSLEKIAKAWDACVHSVFYEFAEQHGGGSFSSKYGVWEKCS